ncbi:TetR/AcrR family transcriptional regulator [Sphingomonas sp. BK580]|uniref:TetR/AcrR family transcriptional regulator n=1 Tax=Sphingomonas sp. BK580 TaxID=2586972 RepID=UPI00161FB684|nr:TetR family transcriptional regulator [Sphingomonas sp. BK580]MBB3694651.1 AcrR family transcriptional regulator [Sphingomonas sp. BK580]
MTKGTQGRGRRSSAQAVSHDHIASAALELLSLKGIDGFSVRDLAKSMEVFPATIYHHMTTKNDLLAAVASYALRDLEPPPQARAWQDWMRELFRRYRSAVQAHPAIAPLIGARIVSNAGVGPDIIERILTVLIEAGFPEDSIVDTFNVVIAAKVGFVTLELAPQPDNVADFHDIMRARVNTVNVETHPLLARFLPKLANRAFMLRWENGSTRPMDASFNAYVDVVISGLEALLRTSSGKTGQIEIVL